MAKYRIVIGCHDLYEHFVEADSEQEAYDKADTLMDMGDWGQLIEGASDVDVFSVTKQGDSNGT